jgi:hypothetical protein
MLHDGLATSMTTTAGHAAFFKNLRFCHRSGGSCASFFRRRSHVRRLMPSASHGLVCVKLMASYSNLGRAPALRRLRSAFFLSRSRCEVDVALWFEPIFRSYCRYAQRRPVLVGDAQLDR